MTYNVAAIAFLAAALHIGDPRENMIEDCVDTLARQEKIPEDQLDMIEELAETVQDHFLSNDDASPFGVLGDILNLNEESPIMQALRARQTILIEEYENLLDDLATDENDPEDYQEIDELHQSIALTRDVFRGMKSELTDKETDMLLDAAVSLESIRKKEPLSLYYAYTTPAAYRAAE